MTKPPAIVSGLLLILVAGAGTTGAQTTPEIDEIKVVASSPLGSTRLQDLAGNHQSITDADLRRRQALDLTELMNRALGSVFVNEAQSNPLQPDVQYRGFVGSPLLGLPQGLAIYQNGVRINEPFGDTVNWALIPNDAIRVMHLVPGSDPMFGLNALGGAIAIDTKNGFTHPGSRGELLLGSFSRVAAQAESGGTLSDGLAWFGTMSYLEEDGWRDFSGTRSLQAFGSLAWQSELTTIDTRLTIVDTDLTGNGAAPVQLLGLDRSAIFTHPDNTRNEMVMVDADLERQFSGAVSLAANAYYRRSDIATLNGDDSNLEECDDLPGFMCDDDDLVLDPAGMPIPADERVAGATVNRTETRQDSAGIGLQVEFLGDVGGMANRFMAGGSFDQSDIGFSSSTELGSLDDKRGAIPGDIFVGSAFTLLSTDHSNASVYFSDTLTIGERLQIGVAGRYNSTETRLRDGIGTALTGDHEFDRFNPSVSVNFRWRAVQAYARYSESSRVPSPVELTCADEDAPCRLPNAFLSDPPLEMVVAKTWEGGLRGGGDRLDWHAGVFHTTSHDDIIFISAGALTNEGFFDNIGKTRRLGFELNLHGELTPAVDWFLNYTRLEATFEDEFVISSPNNPASVAGEIEVHKGDRLPLIPRQLLKAGMHWSASERLGLGADIRANSDRNLRGDEGNDVARLDGYIVLNAYGSWSVSDRLRVFLSVENVLDTEYESFGLFGEAGDVLGDDFDDTRFLSPGAPRAAWIGFELLR